MTTEEPKNRDKDELSKPSLEDDIAKLQAIPAKWKELENPLRELDLIRRGYEPELKRKR